MEPRDIPGPSHYQYYDGSTRLHDFTSQYSSGGQLLTPDQILARQTASRLMPPPPPPQTPQSPQALALAELREKNAIAKFRKFQAKEVSNINKIKIQITLFLLKNPSLAIYKDKFAEQF